MRAEDLAVVVYVAVFADRRDVRAAEDLLARLWAEGRAEILDGALLDWPADSTDPYRRPLQNLPRLAALPESIWRTCASCLRSTTLEPGRYRLPLPPALLAPGHSAVVVFCTTTTPERIEANLQSTGAALTVAAIPPSDFERLRYSQV
jgi:hypothetical protein